MIVVKPDPTQYLTDRLALFAEELRTKNDPVRVANRKKREARQMRRLAAKGLLEPRASPKKIKIAAGMFEPTSGRDTNDREPFVVSHPELNDDIPF